MSYSWKIKVEKSFDEIEKLTVTRVYETESGEKFKNTFDIGLTESEAETGFDYTKEEMITFIESKVNVEELDNDLYQNSLILPPEEN